MRARARTATTGSGSVCTRARQLRACVCARVSVRVRYGARRLLPLCRSLAATARYIVAAAAAARSSARVCVLCVCVRACPSRRQSERDERSEEGVNERDGACERVRRSDRARAAVVSVCVCVRVSPE